MIINYHEVGNFYILRLSLISVFVVYSIAVLAQWPAGHNPFRPGGPGPEHAIYLIPDKNPRLYKIAEGERIIAWIDGNEQGLKKVNEGIIKIKKDSIFLLDSKHRFSDFSKVNLRNFHSYLDSDSASWKVIYPPDSVYKSRSEYRYFLRALAYRVKRERQDWLSAPFHQNMFKLNFALFANLTIAISYEHRFNRTYSLDVEAGYQFQGIPGSVMGPMNTNVFPIWKQSGVMTVAGMKYYFDKKGYIEPVMIYRYLIMSQARTGYPGSQEDLLQDSYANHYGIALRVGTMTRLGRMILDSYFGLGVKVMLIRQLAYGYYPYDDENTVNWYHADHSPNVYNLVQWWPVVNLGIKLGFGY